MMLTGDNGILTRAGDAKDRTNEAQIQEQIHMAYLAALTGGKGEATKGLLKQELNKEFGQNGYTLSQDLTKVIINGKEYEIGGEVTPGQIDIEDLQTETTKPYLPTGFRVSTKSGEQNVSNGLVITDGTNEFVWVEVPMTEAVYPNATINITEFTDAEYLKIAKDLAIYSGSTLSNNPTSLANHLPPESKVGDYKTEYKNMLKSVYQNGGFYVGRYETGIQGTENATTSARDFGEDYYNEHSTNGDIAVIKANVQPYTWVRWEQAQSLAQGIESRDKTSSLLMGVQWDLVLKFIGKNSDTNSSDWGNYCNSQFELERGKYVIYKDDWLMDITWKDGDTAGYVVSGQKLANADFGNTAQGCILTTTGANTTKNCKKNIYDLAGNVWEWTIESTPLSNYPCCNRGGSSGMGGYELPASYRDRAFMTMSSTCSRLSRFALLSSIEF